MTWTKAKDFNLGKAAALPYQINQRTNPVFIIAADTNRLKVTRDRDAGMTGPNETPLLPLDSNPRREAMFDRDQLMKNAAALAARNVFIGTSSWKYEGWLGQLYARSRYEFRGKVAKTRFERECLSEYAEVFKTVCVDAAYYDFPRKEYLEKLADQVPDDFRFGFKVTDAITVKQFPNIDRFGSRAGQSNRDFLNADLFATAFLKPCEAIRAKVGVIMLEFSRFRQGDYATGRDFIADLDRFLAKLPKDWPLAIELRNRQWLGNEYFDCLSRHGVTHVFNSWTDMPSVTEQLALARSRTNPALVAARFLLKPGRSYETAVKSFQPYDKTGEVNDEARTAGRRLIIEGERYEPRRKTFIYVNNRLEGSALETIRAMMKDLPALIADERNAIPGSDELPA